MAGAKEFNLIEDYLDFFAGTEPPTIYNRWGAISGIATLLAKNCWVQHGHKKIYANQYIMLVGESACRKSTAIKIFLRPLLKEVGYESIAANKTSKEKFLMDLEMGMDKVNDPEEHLDVTKPSSGKRGNPTMRELFGIRDSRETSECLVMSDDFNIFIGHGNIEFIELLTDLWDYEGTYSARTKSGKSTLVPNPVLNMFIGDTQIGIAMAFPTEVIGQGIFSRLIQVYSDPSGRRITFPPPPNLEQKKKVLEGFMWIKANFRGPIEIDPYAMIALDEIYQNWKELDDVRFKSYSGRRFDHLLKVCLCVAAARRLRVIDSRTVTLSNTILHYTESFMPKSLGEFGRARNSDIQSKILDLLEKNIDAGGLHPIEGIWPQVSRDLESTTELVRVLSSLKDAGKIQQAMGGKFLPVKKVIDFNKFPHCKILLLREWKEQLEKEE